MTDRKLTAQVRGAADVPGASEHYDAVGKFIKSVRSANFAGTAHESYAAQVGAVKTYVSNQLSSINITTMQYDVWDLESGETYNGATALADALAAISGSVISLRINRDFSAVNITGAQIGDKDVYLNFAGEGQVGEVEWNPTTNGRKFHIRGGEVNGTNGVTIIGDANNLDLDFRQTDIRQLNANGFSTEQIISRGKITCINVNFLEHCISDDWDIDFLAVIGKDPSFNFEIENSNVNAAGAGNPVLDVDIADSFFYSEPAFKLNGAAVSKDALTVVINRGINVIALGLGAATPVARRTYYTALIGTPSPSFIPTIASSPEDLTTKAFVERQKSYINVSKTSNGAGASSLQVGLNEAVDGETILITDHAFVGENLTLGDKSIKISGLAHNQASDPDGLTGSFVWSPTSASKTLNLFNLKINSLTVSGSGSGFDLILYNCDIGSISLTGSSTGNIKVYNSTIRSSFASTDCGVNFYDCIYNSGSTINVTNSSVLAGIAAVFERCTLDNLPVLSGGATTVVSAIVSTCRYGASRRLATYTSIESGSGETRLPITSSSAYDFVQKHELSAISTEATPTKYLVDDSGASNAYASIGAAINQAVTDGHGPANPTYIIVNPKNGGYTEDVFLVGGIYVICIGNGGRAAGCNINGKLTVNSPDAGQTNSYGWIGLDIVQDIDGVNGLEFVGANSQHLYISNSKVYITQNNGSGLIQTNTGSSPLVSQIFGSGFEVIQENAGNTDVLVIHTAGNRTARFGRYACSSPTKSLMSISGTAYIDDRNPDLIGSTSISGSGNLLISGGDIASGSSLPFSLNSGSASIRLFDTLVNSTATDAIGGSAGIATLAGVYWGGSAQTIAAAITKNYLPMHVAKGIQFDNSLNGFTASDVQGAIEEAASSGGVSQETEYFTVSGDFVNLSHVVPLVHRKNVSLWIVGGTEQINKDSAGATSLGGSDVPNFQCDSITANRVYVKDAVASGSNDAHTGLDGIPDGTKIGIRYSY